MEQLLDKITKVDDLLRILNAEKMKQLDIERYNSDLLKYVLEAASKLLFKQNEYNDPYKASIQFNECAYESTPKFYHDIDRDLYLMQANPTGSIKVTQYRQIPATKTVIVEDTSLLKMIGVTNESWYFMIENISMYPYLNAIGCTLGADYDAYVEISKNGQLLYHLRGISSDFSDYNTIFYNSVFGLEDIEKFIEVNNEAEIFHYFITRDLVLYKRVTESDFKRFMKRTV